MIKNKPPTGYRIIYTGIPNTETDVIWSEPRKSWIPIKRGIQDKVEDFIAVARKDS